MTLPKNHILFDSIINFRTFNGMKTRDNATIVDNQIFRSATFDFATDKDLERLRALGIELFIDFRAAPEKDPQLNERFNQQFNRIAEPIDLGDLFSEERVKELKHHTLEDSHQFFLLLYRNFPLRFQPEFRELFRYLEEGKRIAYHCSAGKDRTGISSFLILTALGIHFDDIMENYLESNLYVDRLVDIFDHELEESGMDREQYRELQLIKPEYLNESIRVINHEFGGVEKYLKKTLGVDIDAIRDHYLR